MTKRTKVEVLILILMMAVIVVVGVLVGRHRPSSPLKSMQMFLVSSGCPGSGAPLETLVKQCVEGKQQKINQLLAQPVYPVRTFIQSCPGAEVEARYYYLLAQARLVPVIYHIPLSSLPPSRERVPSK